MDCKVIETELTGPGSGVDRSPGLHLTPIIRDIAVKLGVVKDTGQDDGPSPCQCEKGYIFEDLLSRVFADRMAYRPEEYVLDGISGSPDGIGMHDGEVVLEEYKCTAKSMNRSIDEQWMWLTQIKAYCKMVGVKTAILRVLYLAGDYRPPTPQYRAYILRFSPREIEENWQMITNHAKAMGWKADDAIKVGDRVRHECRGDCGVVVGFREEQTLVHYDNGDKFWNESNLLTKE